MKYCSSCKMIKSLDQFYKVHKGQVAVSNECIECTLKRRKKRYMAIKEKHHCPNCGKNITQKAKQCRDCLLKSMRVNKRCADCGIIISNQATRCKTCQNAKHGREMSNPIGHKRIGSKGYVMIKTKSNGKYKEEAEHRLVMQKVIGRKLTRFEHVHHIDGDTTNNDLSNLLLLSGRQHNKLNHFLGLLNELPSDSKSKIITTLKTRFPELF